MGTNPWNDLPYLVSFIGKKCHSGCTSHLIVGNRKRLSPEIEDILTTVPGDCIDIPIS